MESRQKQTQRNSRRWVRSTHVIGAVACFAAVFGLSGCVVHTIPYTDSERSSRIRSDLESMFAGQEPINGPVSMEEALARALKYNLDNRIGLMESVIAQQNIPVSTIDLLPRIAADAGYTHRSNSAGGRSQSLLSGEESLESSTSQERTSQLGSLQLAWNVLDFGVSYLTAKQSQDNARMVEQRRRKVVQNIAYDIVNAYSLAWIAQHYGYETESLIDEIDDAIESYDRLIAKKLQNPKDALVGQRRLLDTRNQLLELANDMGIARARLARLINAPPGKEYNLSGPGFGVTDIKLSQDIQELEISALANRPELQEQDYAVRISAVEVRKEMLRMFPGLEFSFGAHSDSNKFLYHGSWADAGLRLSWNLLNLVSSPRVRKLRQSEQTLEIARRQALSMSVMTQVRLATQNFAIEKKQLNQAERLAKVDDHLYSLVRGASLTRTRFDLIQAKSAWLTSTIRREIARAELQNAVARVMDSLGVDPIPIEVDAHSIDALANAIKSRWTSMFNRLFITHSDISLSPLKDAAADNALAGHFAPDIPDAYDAVGMLQPN